MNQLKKIIKEFLAYNPIEETRDILNLLDISNYRKKFFCTCPIYQGDFIYQLIDFKKCKSAIEIVFASGSTALYMLAALRKHGGKLISVDYKQADFSYAGVDIIRRAKLNDSHCLIEGNSNQVLPNLLQKNYTFDFAFLDGWKTFDHVMLDLYYINQMLNVGGIIVLDDTRMPSINKAIGFLKSQYQYEELDYSQFGESTKLNIWFFLTSFSLKRPYRALRKTISTSELPTIKDHNFYRSF